LIKSNICTNSVLDINETFMQNAQINQLAKIRCTYHLLLVLYPSLLVTVLSPWCVADGAFATVAVAVYQSEETYSTAAVT